MNARAMLEGYRWRLPDSYAGAHWSDTYAVASTHRDADTFTRSNWHSWQEELGEWIAELPDEIGYGRREGDWPDGTPFVFIARASHWAVGWVEQLHIRDDAPAEVLEIAVGLLEQLEDYPILDDDHHSQLEWDEINEALEAWGYSDVQGDLEALIGRELTDDEEMGLPDTMHSVYCDHGAGDEMHHDGHSPCIDTEWFAEQIAEAWGLEVTA